MLNQEENSELQQRLAATLEELGLSVSYIFMGDRTEFPKLSAGVDAGPARVTALYFFWFWPERAFIGRLMLVEGVPGEFDRWAYELSLDVTMSVEPATSAEAAKDTGASEFSAASTASWEPTCTPFMYQGGFQSGLDQVRLGWGFPVHLTATPADCPPHVRAGLTRLMRACGGRLHDGFAEPFEVGHFSPKYILPGCEPRFWDEFMRQVPLEQRHLYRGVPVG